MKSKTELKRKFVLIAAVLLTLSSVAWAEHGPGNSGNAVLMDDGKYYLLDFVEAGIENLSDLPQADISPSGLRPSPVVRQWGERHLSIFPQSTQALILTQLERIETASPYAAAALLGALRMHSWSFVNLPLKDILLDDGFLSIPISRIHQVAVRNGQTIRIQKQIWDGMNSYNQMGLVFHEILYSLIQPEKDRDGFQKQQSWIVRDILPKLITAGMDQKKILQALRSNGGSLSIGALKFNWGDGREGLMASRLDDEGNYRFYTQRWVEFLAGTRKVDLIFNEAEKNSQYNSTKHPPIPMEPQNICHELSLTKLIEFEYRMMTEMVELKFKTYERPEGVFYFIDLKKDFQLQGQDTQRMGECEFRIREMYQFETQSLRNRFENSQF